MKITKYKVSINLEEFVFLKRKQRYPFCDTYMLVIFLVINIRSFLESTEYLI